MKKRKVLIISFIVLGILMIHLVGFQNPVNAAVTRKDLSESMYFPPIQSQGSVGACAAFATTYYQYTYEYCKLLNLNAKDTVNGSKYWRSPAATYYYNSSGDGSFRINIYNYLKQCGCVSWNTWPFSEDYKLNQCSSKEFYSGYNYKLGGVDWVGNEDIQGIKNILDQGHVLVGASDVYAFWNNIKIGYFKNTSIYCYAMRFRNSNMPETGHELTIVGYDDTLWCDVDKDNVKDPGETGAFKIANSWGTSGHATNNGFFYVLYDALKTSGDLDSILLKEGEKKVPFFNPSFNLSYMTSIVKNEPNLVCEFSGDYIYRNPSSLIISKPYIDSYGNLYKTTFVTTNQPCCGPQQLFLSNSHGFYSPGTALMNMQISDQDIQKYIGNTDLKFKIKAYGVGIVEKSRIKICDNLGNPLSNYDLNDYTTISSSKELIFNVSLKKGDVDYDGDVDRDDAQSILNMALNIGNQSKLQKILGDYDGDGIITLSDANAALRASLNI